MPNDVGGWEAGTTFSNVSLDSMWDGLLYPYQYPGFNSFSINGQNSTIEVGDSIPASVTFIWSTANDSNIKSNSISIYDVTGSKTLLSGSTNDGTEAITMSGSITKTSATSHTFKIEGENNKSDKFSKNKVYYWRWRLFYGEDTNSGPLTESNVESLRASLLTNSFARTYSFVAGGYKYIAYPSSFGTATTFKDTSTNLDVPFENYYIVSITNGFGQTTDYKVHRTTNVLGGDINIQVS